MIYQELSLAPDLTVAENISLGVEPTRGPFVRRGKNSASAPWPHSPEIGRPELPLDLPAGRLSVAEQQLVEIARSVAIGCRVLGSRRADQHPARSKTSSGSSPSSAACATRARDRLHLALPRRGESDCDRFTALRDGRTTGSGDGERRRVDRIVAMMVGRRGRGICTAHAADAGRDGAQHAMTLAASRNRNRRRSNFAAAKSSASPASSARGGPNCCARMMGLDPVAPRQGPRRHCRRLRRPGVRWRQGVGLVSEDRKCEGLALELSIAENITLPKLSGLTPRGWVTPAAQAPRERAAGRAPGDQVPFAAASGERPLGGNQQKVAIARLLHADVDLLLLDEPTRGIDVGSKAEICRLIDELAAGDPARAAPAGGAGRQQLPAGTAGPVRSHCRDVPRPLWCALRGRLPVDGSTALCWRRQGRSDQRWRSSDARRSSQRDVFESLFGNRSRLNT